MTTSIETRVRNLIVSVVGETEAANIDLSRVTRHRYGKDLTVGDSHCDGCLTVGPSDYVDVWVRGNPVTTEDLPAHIPGVFEHFKDMYDTRRSGDLIAWATTRRSMHDADPGIAVTRRGGDVWLASSDSLPDTWGDLEPDSEHVDLDVEAADAELKHLGYRRTDDWIDSGGQWAADVEEAKPALTSTTLSVVTHTERIVGDGTSAYIVPQGGGDPEVIGGALINLGTIPANEDPDGWIYGADAVLESAGWQRTGDWIGSGFVSAPVEALSGSQKA